MVLFPDSFDELLKTASKELKMNALRVFTMDGAEVDNILLLRYFSSLCLVIVSASILNLELMPSDI